MLENVLAEQKIRRRRSLGMEVGALELDAGPCKGLAIARDQLGDDVEAEIGDVTPVDQLRELPVTAPCVDDGAHVCCPRQPLDNRPVDIRGSRARSLPGASAPCGRLVDIAEGRACFVARRHREA